MGRGRKEETDSHKWAWLSYSVTPYRSSSQSFSFPRSRFRNNSNARIIVSSIFFEGVPFGKYFSIRFFGILNCSAWFGFSSIIIDKIMHMAFSTFLLYSVGQSAVGWLFFLVRELLLHFFYKRHIIRIII